MSFIKDFKDLKKDISMTVNEDKSENTTEKVEAGKEPVSGPAENTGAVEKRPASNDTTVVAVGAVIRGNLESEGSIAVYGTVFGNIECSRKLIVTGTVKGDLHADEIFVNKASVDGQIVSSGNLKIGNGSLILGNVYGKTAVIAGAIKGEIDIKGPVIIDNTAVVKGNIKSASVQINNGAVIEGYCTQCYHDVDVNSIFDITFPKSERVKESQEEQPPQEVPAHNAEEEASVLTEKVTQEMAESVTMAEVPAADVQVTEETPSLPQE